MKCALIIPAWRPEDLFPAKTAASQLNYWQPLGTLYVAACLQRAGHDVVFYNGAFLSQHTILRRVQQQQPFLIGIYATTFGWPRAVETATALKAVLPHCYICVGGPYPIALQATCLEQQPCIDAVVTGEGEQTVTELAAWLESRSYDAQPYAETAVVTCSVKGIAYRSAGQIILNPPRPMIENLDTIPFPARELLHDDTVYLPPPATYKRKPVAVIISSRGCNRRCIFCSQIDPQRRSGKRGIRFRSISNVMSEIELCLQQGYREIKFIDDSLAADYARLMGLCKAIQKRALDFTWFASVCANQVDRPLLQAMKDAGCWAILIGAESGVQKNLNTLRKGITLQHIQTAVHTAQDVGLVVTTPFLFGIPGETYTDALATIDFAIRLNPDFANFHALTAFPGTYLYEQRDRFGTVSNELHEYTYQGAAFVPYSMTRSEIHALRRLAFRRFYLRPGFVWRRLRSLYRDQTFNRDTLVAITKGIKSLFWICRDKHIFQRPANSSDMGSRR